MGLIFLSAMASSVALTCAEEQLSPEVALGTSLVTLTAATMIVGAATVAVGESGRRQEVGHGWAWVVHVWCVHTPCL